jgi:hypothetical protein
MEGNQQNMILNLLKPNVRVHVRVINEYVGIGYNKLKIIMYPDINPDILSGLKLPIYVIGDLISPKRKYVTINKAK